MLKSVVLPAPLAPIIPTIAPFGTLIERSSKSTLSSITFFKLFVSITRSPSLGAVGIII